MLINFDPTTHFTASQDLIPGGFAEILATWDENLKLLT